MKRGVIVVAELSDEAANARQLKPALGSSVRI